MKRLFHFIPALVFTGLISACVSTKHYAQAEKDFCDCLSGVKAPADEFCSEWSADVQRQSDKLDIRMARLSSRNEEKYEVLLLQIELIKEERDTCLARVGRYYSGK